MEKKLRKQGEAAFVLGILILGLGTAFMSVGGFGMSVVVSPAYVLSDLFAGIAPGTMCYLCQGFLVVVTCIMLRKFRISFLFTFLAAVLFGLSVNLFTALLSVFGFSSVPARIICFAVGQLLNAFSIALLLHSYLPQQAPELFVKSLAEVLHRDVYKVKYLYDLCSLVLTLALSFLFFRQMRYIGVGTFVSAAVNGPIIGFFGRKMDELADFSPRIQKLYDLLA